MTVLCLGYLLVAASRPESILNEPSLGAQPMTARTLGMGGAQHGTADGADAIWLNPAGMATTKKYLITGDYAWSQEASAHKPHLAVVDSQTTVIAAGASYGYERRGNAGDLDLHRIHFALAYNISFFSIGASLKYFSASRSRVTSDILPPQNGTFTGFNTDVGILLQPVSFISLGVTAHNVIPREDTRETQPFSVGVGAAGHIFGLELAADCLIDFKSLNRTETRWHFGAEYAIIGMLPLRGGFIYDRIGGDMFWSVGAGFQQATFGIDLAYRQGVAVTDNRTLAVGIRIALN